MNSKTKWPVLITLATVTVLSLAYGCGKKNPKEEQSSGPLRLVSWGGQFEQDLLKLWIEPAALQAGVKIEAGSWDGEYGALSTRIERGINDWDLVHVEDLYISSPDAPKIFEVFTNRQLPTILDPELRQKASVAAPLLQYAYVLTYFTNNPDLQSVLQKKGRGSPSWEDFWNVAAIPGRRGLRDFPVGNIEIALASMQSNITDSLYSTNLSRAELEKTVDRALERLSSLKQDIVWWTTGDKLQKSLTSGEVTMAAAWSGRVRSAHAELCGTNLNCPLDVSQSTALVATDWWIIPKNAAHAESANKLLVAMFTHKDAPRWAGAFSTKQAYAVQIQTQISDPVAKKYLDLNSSNTNILTRISDTFWGNNYDWISRKWTTWRASH